MDYEKLIEQLRDENNCDVLDCVLDYVKDTADAIEALLAEREAMMEDLRCEASCTVCKHSHRDEAEPPCCYCIATPRGTRNCWEWRGPKEHKNGK